MLVKVKSWLLIILRRVSYILLGLFGRIWYFIRPYPIVLCYHSISEDNWFHSVSLRMLTAQLTWLSSVANPVTLDDIYKHITGEVVLREPGFAVTIDDGYKNVLHAEGLFRSLGIRPTIFVLSNSEHANRGELGAEYEFLSPVDIKNLVRQGWLVGSHSATHADFFALGVDETTKEITE